MMTPTIRLLASLLPAGLLAGCSMLTPQPAWKLAVAGDGPGELHRIDIRELVVANLPKSRYGNPAQYTVFGQEYTVLDSADGFKQQGVASWYGKKFHGRPTSSGEPYDMHQLTAAHKNLPLPTYVRVTRVDNGESVVVKVNDRGPFVGDRIIDLSYAAAARLGMIEQGKADVFIEALSSHEPVVDASAQPLVPAAPVDAVVTTEVTPSVEAALVGGSAEASRFLQVGAYSDELNAKAMLVSLREFLDVPASISVDDSGQLYRVRVGPLADQDRMRHARETLAQAGIDSYRVTD
ncbi:septal ring lytic transglycosylase RlpA family protein [Granulosicoccus sp. 3-233]|uniref:septal ring lytic transglycosylase RlpA family protein n=1 Tax=Granulosicoccus sp. 3-233 TaxID=3417969 RepID=UPI003D34B1AA